MKKMNTSTLITTNICVKFCEKSIKGGRYVALNQYHKPIVSDEVFNIISTELEKSGIIYVILDEYC